MEPNNDAELDSPELNKTKDDSERYTPRMDKTQRRPEEKNLKKCGVAIRNTSKRKPYWQHLINTPRPLASQRCRCTHQTTNTPNLQNLQNLDRRSPQEEGFTLPTMSLPARLTQDKVCTLAGCHCGWDFQLYFEHACELELSRLFHMVHCHLQHTFNSCLNVFWLQPCAQGDRLFPLPFPFLFLLLLLRCPRRLPPLP